MAMAGQRVPSLPLILPCLYVLLHIFKTGESLVLPLVDCSDQSLCLAQKKGGQFGLDAGYTGSFNYGIFAKLVSAKPKTYVQDLGGSLVTSVQVFTPSACCWACGDSNGACAYWHFYVGPPNPYPPPEWDGNFCYLLFPGTVPSQPTHKEQLSIYRTHSASWVGGTCRTSRSRRLLSHPTLLDRIGGMDVRQESFCAVADEDLHVNVLLQGPYENATATSAEVLSSKSFATTAWLEEVGLLWRNNGSEHSFLVTARGAEGKLGHNLNAIVWIDGQEIQMQVGDELVSAGGLHVTMESSVALMDMDNSLFVVSTKVRGHFSLSFHFSKVLVDGQDYFRIALRGDILKGASKMGGLLRKEPSLAARGNFQLQSAQTLLQLLHGSSTAGVREVAATTFLTTHSLVPDCAHAKFFSA
eukprot:TRINITY_DN3608_c0_g2_i1.p1 TRINITY_DN3608_c0_g2~~TRINITY_DN3608_c0_g2_i1.p1  ORF type:complete len:413 (-),score=79.09 TRINITY_DN3608_c0_g2_i1:113-1351(-)